MTCGTPRCSSRTASLHTRSLRTAQGDRHIRGWADDGETVLEPSFTFHGFRYAEVTPAPSCSTPRSLAVGTDTPARSTFGCSDPALTRFHENVPGPSGTTSSPSRPTARSATSGSAGPATRRCSRRPRAHCSTRGLLASWLGRPGPRPDRGRRGPERRPRTSSATGPSVTSAGPAGPTRPRSFPGPCTCAYADTEVLAATSCRACGRWSSYCRRRRQDDGLLGGEFQFGDWLDPDAPGDRPHEAKTSSDFLANAFFAHSARLAACRSAVGDADGPGPTRRSPTTSAARTWARWRRRADHPDRLRGRRSSSASRRTRRSEVGRALADLVRTPTAASRPASSARRWCCRR